MMGLLAGEGQSDLQGALLSTTTTPVGHSVKQAGSSSGAQPTHTHVYFVFSQ